MELIDLIPEFNLYEEFWKIYTKAEVIPPQYIAPDAVVERAIIGEGAEIHGEVYNSIIGPGVLIRKGTVVRDSIIMKGVEIGHDTKVNKAIVAENTVIGWECEIGVGEEKPNVWKPDIYTDGMVTIAENSVIPNYVRIGKNTAISGGTTVDDYPSGRLESGENIVKVGDGR
jgi:glucose-1-phosphate adenylyltransferase